MGKKDAVRRSISLATAVAAVGVVAAASAVGWNAVTWTDPESDWRGLEGTFAELSISFAFAATLLGVIAVTTRSRRTAFAVPGLALGVITLGFWIWLVQNIG